MIRGAFWLLVLVHLTTVSSIGLGLRSADLAQTLRGHTTATTQEPAWVRRSMIESMLLYNRSTDLHVHACEGHEADMVESTSTGSEVFPVPSLATASPNVECQCTGQQWNCPKPLVSAPYALRDVMYRTC